MQCAICRTTIQMRDDRVVTTRDGLVVHIACADQEATAAWARRCRHALLDSCLLTGTIGSLWSVFGAGFGVLAIAAGCTLHLARHWHWWRRLAYRARRGLRVKG